MKEASTKKLIYNRYDKSLLKDLPNVLFNGNIIVVQTKEEADRAVRFLLTQNILGIDTETRPSFKKGIINTVSLLQVSTYDTCFLFRLKYIGLTPSLINLLEDTLVPKIGLSLGDDISALQRVKDFQPGFFIDLQKHVGEIGIKDLGLQKLYANLFGEKISKAQRLSNWDADVLTNKQIAYAATDAWACIRLYEEFIRLEKTGNYHLVKVEE